MFIYIFLLLMLIIFSGFLIKSNFFWSLLLIDWKFFILFLEFNFLKNLFFFLLIVVVGSVFIFLNFYLEDEFLLMYFLLILSIFILSMVFLIFSSNLLTIMLGWDLLGISSYFLVLFYNNWDSNVGSMNVSLTNRLGDYFMFFFFSFFFFFSWGLENFSNFKWIPFIMLIFMGFTKSAQYPFSSWLPKAMSAPTPVSALVHSSTLVTAGVILISNFNSALMSNNLEMILFWGGIFTVGSASIMSLLEKDLKKVVALSTLSQMGFSFLILGIGLMYYSLIHLVSHALFKSCLFIQIGMLIYFSYGQQDGRGFSGGSNFLKIVHFQMLITLFCLCGLFFSSGMMSKDLILEFFYFYNVYSGVMYFFFIFISLTFFYSFKLFYGLMSVSYGSMIMHFNNLLFSSSIILIFLSISGIYFLLGNFFFIPSFFLYLDVYTPLLYIFFFFIFKNILMNYKNIYLKFSFLVDLYALLFSFFTLSIKFLDNPLLKFFLNIVSLSISNFMKKMTLMINFFFLYFFFFLFIIYED